MITPIRLQNYEIGDYVYVREERRTGQPERWRLAIIVSVQAWAEPIAAPRSQFKTGSTDTLGPRSIVLIAKIANANGDFAHGSVARVTKPEDIREREEVMSWRRVVEVVEEVPAGEQMVLSPSERVTASQNHCSGNYDDNADGNCPPCTNLAGCGLVGCPSGGDVLARADREEEGG